MKIPESRAARERYELRRTVGFELGKGRRLDDVLARVDREVKLEVAGPVTQRSVLDALEAAYPMLRGTIRDHLTHQRRPFLRFFACEEDLSHEPPDAPLPDAVAAVRELMMRVNERPPLLWYKVAVSSEKFVLKISNRPSPS